MTSEIPAYAQRAYALLYSKYGWQKPFTQSVIDWITSGSMQKKIFSVLLRAGWISKKSRDMYLCKRPEKVMEELLEFKVPEIIKKATRPYAFTGLSAIEIWSDYVYVQRGRERSPYFIKILARNLPYWKKYWNHYSIPHYLHQGSTIGEFMILIPVKKMKSVERGGFFVEPLSDTIKSAKKNEMFAYAYQYLVKKYGLPAKTRKRNI